MGQIFNGNFRNSCILAKKGTPSLNPPEEDPPEEDPPEDDPLRGPPLPFFEIVKIFLARFLVFSFFGTIKSEKIFY